MSVIGQKLVAPGGLRGLRKDREYHYVGRCAERGLVTLCFFEEDEIAAHVDVIDEVQFEQGLIDERLVPLEDDNNYPPWIDRFVGAEDEHQFAMSVHEFAKKNAPHVSRWEETLKPLIDDANNILSVVDPVGLINKRLGRRVCKSQKSKARSLFFSYLCFGRNEYALLPNTWKNGRFPRDDSPPAENYGRRNGRTGEFSGYACGTAERKKCIQAYEKHRAPGRTYAEIYRRSLRSHFGCTTRKVDKVLEVVQPEGLPFPSQAQFMSRVFRHFGREAVHKLRYSDERVRRTQSEHVGKFTEKCSNIMERIEADVYYVAETVRGLEAQYSTVMCIARILDTTTSMRVGIGCSLNGERAEAYSMAEFSMGIPKDLFASYFGLQYEPSYWPSTGLPMTHIVDRGAGSKQSLIDEILEHSAHVELSKGYSGQSKAPVEASNPRRTKMEGRPCFVVSHLDPFRYFAREIVRTATENWTSDVSERLTKEMIENSVKPRPIHIWNHLSQRCRTDAVHVPFDELVRKYLPKRKIKIDRRGAWIEDIRFKSDELRDSRICERVSGNGSYKIDGYILPMSLRQIWIEDKGQLIEASMVPSLLGDDDETNWTVATLADMAKRRRDLESEAREEDIAHHLAASEMFSEQTGEPYYGGSMTRSKPKTKRPESLVELEQIRAIFGGNG